MLQVADIYEVSVHAADHQEVLLVSGDACCLQH